jgi:uncharacterized protein with HEPN domain
MTPDDDARLRHMLEAARDAMGFMEDCSREDLDRDRKLALAIVKCIEIIGEAAAKVTAETRQSNPSIPWPAIVGMRNRLIHGYFEIDLDRVWNTVRINLPPLVEMLVEAIGPNCPD